MHRFIVHSVSIVHKDEAVLVSDHSLINPELLGVHVRIVGIVYEFSNGPKGPSVAGGIGVKVLGIKLWVRKRRQAQKQLLVLLLDIKRR